MFLVAAGHDPHFTAAHHSGNWHLYEGTGGPLGVVARHLQRIKTPNTIDATHLFKNDPGYYRIAFLPAHGEYDHALSVRSDHGGKSIETRIRLKKDAGDRLLKKLRY